MGDPATRSHHPRTRRLSANESPAPPTRSHHPRTALSERTSHHPHLATPPHHRTAPKRTNAPPHPRTHSVAPAPPPPTAHHTCTPADEREQVAPAPPAHHATDRPTHPPRRPQTHPAAAPQNDTPPSHPPTHQRRLGPRRDSAGGGGASERAPTRRRAKPTQPPRPKRTHLPAAHRPSRGWGGPPGRACGTAASREPASCELRSVRDLNGGPPHPMRRPPADREVGVGVAPSRPRPPPVLAPNSGRARSGWPGAPRAPSHVGVGRP